MKRGLFAGNNHIDIIAASQAVVGHRQKSVRIRGQIDTHNFSLLVDYMIDKSRILMRKAVVILAPHGRGDEQI